MRPQTISLTNPISGASGWVPFDLYVPTANVEWATYVTGTANYDLEGTISDVWTSGATVTTFKIAAKTGLTANDSGNILTPLSAIRLLGNSGTGAVSLVVRQQSTQ